MIMSKQNNLLNKLVNAPDKKDLEKTIEAKQNDVKKEENVKKVGRESKRFNVLSYDIEEDDEILVVSIKEQINNAGILIQDVYDKFDDEGEAWNLIYPLRVRNSIQAKSFMKWCYVLDIEPVITFIPKGDSDTDE